jgi:hypothetical protein
VRLVYGVALADVEHPEYVLRTAELLERMAAALREEAAGGAVISHVDAHVELESGESVTLLGYAEKPRARPKLVIPG